MDKHRRKKIIIALLPVLLAALFFWLSLPKKLFDDPYSTVVYGRDGDLLGARIAVDGQWRFPGLDSLPEKYCSALLEFEDQYFYWHPGVNPFSMFRAVIQNIRSREIVSGGSTITMQVMRMSRKKGKRSVGQKIKESFLAIRLEFTTSKEDILKEYANNAPFGGNVVGIEAAAWRYFARSPNDLTWSESALLAVLPNAPSLIHPGKNRKLLEEKRNRLLMRLRDKDMLDSLTCALSMEEPLPEKPLPLPNIVPHLTDKVQLKVENTKLYTTIDQDLQERCNEMLNMHHRRLEGNEIHNMACMIMKVNTAEVLAYVGNAQDQHMRHQNSVDIIPARRSTGSILKPFLFAGMLDNGDILQSSLIPDVPIRYNGYAPKNYDRSYQGAVPAYNALERSLNIPAVIMLKRFGVDPFLSLLRDLGFSTFVKDKDHYGLTLILGGAETSLWELSGVYASMARTLNHYLESDGFYYHNDYRMPVLQRDNELARGGEQEEGLLSASSIYLTFQALLDVNRPENLSLWYLMSSSRKIAWKTGTSYGARDAWAVGVTPEYLVAVWAGNADGEGRPGMSGVTSAAPLMFDLFSLLPETTWFEAPLDDMATAGVCRKSGYIAGPHCEEIDSVLVVPKGLKSKSCPYHYTIHLDKTKKNRVNSSCYSVAEMHRTPWFVLPPLMEWYYLRNNPGYELLPPIMTSCVDETISNLEIVYPEWDSHVVIPRELDGSKGKLVLEAAHRNRTEQLFWHIDEQYIGKTKNIHQLSVDIQSGSHILTVVDQSGASKKVTFKVLR